MKIDLMTIEQIVDEVHKAKCLKLKGLKLELLSRTDLLKHLWKSKCPVIQNLMKKIIE